MLKDILKAKKEKKPLLMMNHLVIGYPSLEDNWIMLETMAAAGADTIELQFPFSEPVADGPLFVQANQAALDTGITVSACFEFMEKATKAFDIPFLMMGYYNTVFAMGEERFCQRLAEVGAKGMIVPDLPIEESKNFFASAEKYELSPVLIVTPNSSAERIAEVTKHSKGFVYCVARKGVTGLSTSFDLDLGTYLETVKSTTDLPIALGFGVKSHEDLDYLVGKVDMAIIGTAGLNAYKAGGKKGLSDLLSWKN